MNPFRSFTPPLKTWIIVLCMLCLGCPSFVQAMEMTVDMNALVQETQRSSRELDDVLLTWWLPEAMWTLFMTKSPNIPEQDKQLFLNSVRPYTVFLAVDGRIGKNGVPTFQDRNFLMKTVRLIDQNGKKYKPLKDEDISPEAKESLTKVFPFFARSLGPLGASLHFVVFPAEDAKGAPIATAFNDGTFVLKMARRSFRWRTPLGPLVPPQHCPESGEELPGGWKYNPWTGTKLR